MEKTGRFTTTHSLLWEQIPTIMTLSSIRLATNHHSVARQKYVTYTYLSLEPCRHRYRLLQANIARLLMPYRCLSRQLNPKIKPTLNLVSRRSTTQLNALFAGKNLAVCKSETDTLNRTFPIRFIAHPRVVVGQAVVNMTLKSIGRGNTQIPVESP